MGIFRTVKKGVTSGWSVRRWVGYEGIKENGNVIGKLFQSAISNPSKTEPESPSKETFEMAMKRFNMTEDDLKKRIRSGRQVYWSCLGGSLAILAYMFYQFSIHEMIAGLVCLMLALVLLAYAFRENFNVFQMKQRRLGCTAAQWLGSFLVRSKK